MYASIDSNIPEDLETRSQQCIPNNNSLKTAVSRILKCTREDRWLPSCHDHEQNTTNNQRITPRARMDPDGAVEDTIIG